MGVADQLTMPGTTAALRGSEEERQQARRAVARIALRHQAAPAEVRTVLDVLGLIEETR